MNIDSGGSKSITGFHAYDFSNLNVNQQGDTLLFKLIVKGIEDVYLLSLKDRIKKIEIGKNTNQEMSGGLSNPTYSKDNKQISLMASYRLFTLNLRDNKLTQVWSGLNQEDQAMPIFSKFNSEGNKIFFSVLNIVNRQYTRSAKLFIYDLVQKRNTEVFIPMTN